MGKQDRLTQAQYDIIRSHNDYLREAAINRIATIRRIPMADRPNYLKGELQYWVHYEKALKHSTAIALQRLETLDNGRFTTVSRANDSPKARSGDRTS